VSLIRDKVKDGRLLLQHNIEYGFVRNLIGGAVIVFPLTALSAPFFYFSHPIIFWTFLVMSAGFLTLIVFSRRILEIYGVAYAKVLIQEYMGLKQ
jgi:hypothetical protein